MLDLEQLLTLQYHIEYNSSKDPLDSLHSKQRQFVLDPALRITGDWGRRAGKTTAVAIKIILKALESPADGTDESIIGFMSTTKSHAERLMWGRLQSLSVQYKLGIEFNSTKLIAKFPNGCQVWILGADKPHDWEKLRGFAYRMIVIDEAQAIRGTVNSLIDEVLDPALGDYEGQLVLTGTPGAACVGFFYEAATGQVAEWVNYHGTILDNPYFPLWRNRPDWEERAKAWLEKKRKSKSWAEDHPSYMREWLGRWVRDEFGLVYRFNRERNVYDGKLPEGHDWQCVLGVDLGHDDAFAMHVWYFSDTHPGLFGADTFKRSGLLSDDWAELIREWIGKHSPIRVVADTGGLGKEIVKTMSQRKGLPIHPAEKKKKFDYVKLMNSDLATGKIKIQKGSPLIGEMELLQYHESGRMLEDPAFENDACDAALYAWREAYHWINREREVIPEQGTTEWYEREAAKLKKQRQAALRRRRRR